MKEHGKPQLRTKQPRHILSTLFFEPCFVPDISKHMIQNWLKSVKHSVILISVLVEGVNTMGVSYQVFKTSSVQPRFCPGYYSKKKRALISKDGTKTSVASGFQDIMRYQWSNSSIYSWHSDVKTDEHIPVWVFKRFEWKALSVFTWPYWYPTSFF